MMSFVINRSFEAFLIFHSRIFLSSCCTQILSSLSQLSPLLCQEVTFSSKCLCSEYEVFPRSNSRLCCLTSSPTTSYTLKCTHSIKKNIKATTTKTKTTTTTSIYTLCTHRSESYFEMILVFLIYVKYRANTTTFRHCNNDRSTGDFKSHKMYE